MQAVRDADQAREVHGPIEPLLPALPAKRVDVVPQSHLKVDIIRAPLGRTYFDSLYVNVL